MSTLHFTLQRDAYGQLVFLAENGERHQGVTPVRAFPIADAHGIQFLVRDLTQLDRNSRKLLDRFL